MKSPASKIRTTPGIRSATLASIRRIRAWAAARRTKRPWSMPSVDQVIDEGCPTSNALGNLGRPHPRASGVAARWMAFTIAS